MCPSFQNNDMTTSNNQCLFFGEAWESSSEQLLNLFHYAKDSDLLGNFFKLCSSALIKEIANLSIMEQNQFPRFNTIMELVDAHYQQGGYNDVINSVLLCLTQFGYFIR